MSIETKKMAPAPLTKKEKVRLLGEKMQELLTTESEKQQWKTLESIGNLKFLKAYESYVDALAKFEKLEGERSLIETDKDKIKTLIKKMNKLVNFAKENKSAEYFMWKEEEEKFIRAERRGGFFR
jgi:hypothetical protein